MQRILGKLKALGQHMRLFAAGVLLLLLVTASAQAQTAVTKYAAMASQLHRDCARNPDALHLYTIGASAVSRHPLLMVRVTAAMPGESLVNAPRLLVICRQHGDEPVSTQAALRWVSRCAAMPSGALSRTLGGVTVYIVPIANPDGADKLSRFTGTSGDMNRDWGVFALPETRALYAAYRQIAPSAVIDMHSWDLTDPFQANSVEASPGSYSSASQPRLASGAIQSGIIKAVRGVTGQEVSALSYSPEADPRLCHRYFAALGTPAVLVETAAGPSDSRDEMEGRVQYDLAALSGAVQAVSADTRGVTSASLPSQSPYLLSADALAGRVHPQIVSAAAQPRYTAAQLTAGRVRAVRVALALYSAACLILVAVCRKTLASAWRRLLIGRSRVSQNGAYVSIRARHYPPEARHKSGELVAASVMKRSAPIRCR